MLFFASCTQSYYSENKTINNAWLKKTPVTFTFNIDNDKILYNLNLIVRNNNEYPYRNIYFFTELEGKRDTLQFELANPDGTWKGSGITETKEIYFNYKQKYLFQKKGIHRLKIFQGMRKDTLKGIKDLGLVIEKSK